MPNANWYHLGIDWGHVHHGVKYRIIDMGGRSERWVLCEECGDWYLQCTVWDAPTEGYSLSNYTECD